MQPVRSFRKDNISNEFGWNDNTDQAWNSIKVLDAVEMSISQAYSKAVPEGGTACVPNSIEATVSNDTEDPRVPYCAVTPKIDWEIEPKWWSRGETRSGHHAVLVVEHRGRQLS